MYTDQEISEMRKLELGIPCPLKERSLFKIALEGKRPRDIRDISETRLPFIQGSVRNPKWPKTNVITGDITSTFLDRRDRDVEVYTGISSTKDLIFLMKISEEGKILAYNMVLSLCSRGDELFSRKLPLRATLDYDEDDQTIEVNEDDKCGFEGTVLKASLKVDSSSGKKIPLFFGPLVECL